MNKERMRFVGFRLNERERVIIRMYARKWKVSQSEALRRILNSISQMVHGR